LEDARERLKAALGWQGEVVFTSGASEALEIALTRSALPLAAVSSVEHDAVLRCAAGAAVFEVDEDGLVDAEAMPRGGLVAVQHVNSETGVIQPLAAIADAVRGREGLLLAAWLGAPVTLVAVRANSMIIHAASPQEPCHKPVRAVPVRTPGFIEVDADPGDRAEAVCSPHDQRQVAGRCPFEDIDYPGDGGRRLPTWHRRSRGWDACGQSARPGKSLDRSSPTERNKPEVGGREP
jgi:hypothetical protein